MLSGEAVGTIGVAAAGAALGSFLGPLGMIAGAVVGGALGNKIGEGAEDVDSDNVDNANQTESKE
ncbi:hypothetical protein H8B09_09965 [Paenibacillus sp. PR3]|uniref:Glycine zipper domain-containing protein n=1 Tax=Paenibacillus terricola TaxID=2763503 RepID=A0ABR8MVY2_9BACL|nr:hypothetical protein [Paenibacillus terricola]